MVANLAADFLAHRVVDAVHRQIEIAVLLCKRYSGARFLIFFAGGGNGSRQNVIDAVDS